MRTNKRYVRSAMFMALLAAFGASRVALAVDEIEPNDPANEAQQLVIGSDGTAQVNGSIDATSTHRDVDFYSFQAQAGDVITVDIDNGIHADGTGVDTNIAVFGPGGSGPLTELAYSDDPDSVDTGSVVSLSSGCLTSFGAATTCDARIDNFHVQQTGTYVIGVSSAPGYWYDVNNLTDGTIGYNTNGSYTLLVSGVSPLQQPPVPQPPPPQPSVQQISIEVKPGKREIMPIQSFARGSVPVALLSSAEFDATTVDQGSLKFGKTGNEETWVRCNGGGSDVDGDGRPDLICHFALDKANFAVGDTSGVLTGKTVSGDDFEGRGLLKVLPSKHKRR